MRRHGFTLIEAFALVAVLMVLILAAALFPKFARPRETGRYSSCQSNLKQIGLAFAQYSQDANGRFPRAAFPDRPRTSPTSHAYGWADAIQPYSKNFAVYQCPTEAKPPPMAATHDLTVFGYTDYWFNSRLSGIKWGEVTSGPTTFLAGEGNDGTDATNARYSYSAPPSSWLTGKTSPLFRHLGGANYLFADGHVKWLKPEQVTTAAPNGKHYTFAVK